MSLLSNDLPKKTRSLELPTAEIVRVFNLCLTRPEDSVLNIIMKATPAILRLLAQCPNTNTSDIVSEWLSKLENEASYNGLRCSGHAVALGATFNVIDSASTDGTASELRQRITKVLTFRSTPAVAIAARTIALRALGVLLQNPVKGTSSTKTCLESDVEAQIGSALNIALNDYTITERGDVGALVRLEALNSVSFAWSSGVLQNSKHNERGQQIYADVLRLSLERMDKIRVRAAQLLRQDMPNGSPDARIEIPDDVSSRAYFLNALSMLQPTTSPVIRNAICTGFVSSAGMASETVVQNSRAALLDFLDASSDDVSNASYCTLLDFANCILMLLKQYIAEDRVLLPLLETIAFLFDMQVLPCLISTSFKYVRNLQFSIQLLCIVKLLSYAQMNAEQYSLTN